MVSLGKCVRITDKDSTGHDREGVVVMIGDDGDYLVAVSERGQIRYWASSVEQIPVPGDTVEIVEPGSPFHGTHGVLVRTRCGEPFPFAVFVGAVGVHMVTGIRLPVEPAAVAA